jgi:hypothetical protein
MQLGAVLIKNYTSLEKYKKSSTWFFINYYLQSTPKNPYVLDEKKISPSLANLLNLIFIKINPRGKELAMAIPRTHGIGNIVAQGHHFHMPL